MSIGLRRLMILAAVTFVVAAWAGATVAVDALNRAPAPASPAFFTSLNERIADARRISIVSPDGAVNVRLGADGRWAADNRGGFNADMAAIRETLLDLADLKLEAPKTANPDWHDALELSAPEDGGTGVRLTVEDEGGETLVDLILGKPAPFASFAIDGLAPRRYARAANDDQTWLVSGDLSPSTEAADWLALDGMLEIERDAIQSVRVRPVDSDAWTASRDAAEALNFSIEGIPSGREATSESAANASAFALANLTLMDARPADEITGAPRGETQYSLFDGTTIALQLTDGEVEKWITARAEGPQADQLNAQLNGWAFAVSDWTFDKFATPREELLAPIGGE